MIMAMVMKRSCGRWSWQRRYWRQSMLFWTISGTPASREHRQILLSRTSLPQTKVFCQDCAQNFFESQFNFFRTLSECSNLTSELEVARSPLSPWAEGSRRVYFRFFETYRVSKKSEFYWIEHLQICHEYQKYFFPTGNRISKCSI